jgi:hypothetical protein
VGLEEAEGQGNVVGKLTPESGTSGSDDRSQVSTEDGKSLIQLGRNGSVPGYACDLEVDGLSFSTTKIAPETARSAIQHRHLLPNFFTAGMQLSLEDHAKYLPGTPYLEVAHIPRPPTSNRSQPVQLFLRFHQEKVSSAHYFAWFDYHQLYTNLLHAMAEDSLALQYAMVAFSALVYSAKVQRASDQVALHYYTLAIKELQPLLNEIVHQKGEIALATALQLASFDVNSFLQI